ncbi:MAG: DUF4386 domain-containing protein [Actinomycetes bacterium]
MTITAEALAPTKRVPVTALRKTAFAAGVFYIITFIASIPALALYAPILDNPNYVLTTGTDTGVIFGGLLEVITGLAGIATAVVLFPVLKRQNVGVALGLVTSRVVEAGIIILGVVSILSIVTLRQGMAGATGATADSMVTTAKALVAMHDWTFLLGPGLMPGVNALLLGYLLYKSRLVPRVIPMMGLVGAPILIASGIAVMFGVYPQLSAWSALATVLIFAWEASVGIYLVVKGFKPSPITADMR